MSDSSQEAPQEASKAPARKRPLPGQRRTQILQTLAVMLEKPSAERVTTAALAKKIGVSEAALYRHFASKAQMFEGLLGYIEQHCLYPLKQIRESEMGAGEQAYRMVATVLQFAESNPGMARVMMGEALVLENERLQQRMTALFDQFEMLLKDALYYWASEKSHPTPSVQAQVQAQLLTAFVQGQITRFVRSDLRRKPTEQMQNVLTLIL